MSNQNIPQYSGQINNVATAVTIVPKAPTGSGGSDIRTLLLANTSATPPLVTLSDGVNNWYILVPANNTITLHNIPSDRLATGWTLTCSPGVNSIWYSVTTN